MNEEQPRDTSPEQSLAMPAEMLNRALEEARLLENPGQRAIILGAVAGRTSDPTARKQIIDESMATLDAWRDPSNAEAYDETNNPDSVAAFVAKETLEPSIIKSMPEGAERDELLAKAALEHKTPSLAPEDNDFGGQDAYWGAYAVENRDGTALERIEDPLTKLDAVAKLIGKAEQAEDTAEAARLHTEALATFFELEQGDRDLGMSHYAVNLDPGYAELIHDPVTRAATYLELARQNPNNQSYFDEAATAARTAQEQGVRLEDSEILSSAQALWQQLALESNNTRWLDELPHGEIRDRTIAKVAAKTGNVEAALSIEDPRWRDVALVDLMREGYATRANGERLEDQVTEGHWRTIGKAVSAAHIPDSNIRAAMQESIFNEAAQIGPETLLATVIEARDVGKALELLHDPGHSINPLQFADAAVRMNAPQLAEQLPQDTSLQIGMRNEALKKLALARKDPALIAAISDPDERAWAYVEFYDATYP